MNGIFIAKDYVRGTNYEARFFFVLSNSYLVLNLIFLLMQLSQKISTARKTKGITQDELADKSGVTVRTIQRIESGETQPRAFTIKAIADALEMPFENFQVVENGSLERRSLGADKNFLQLLVLSCFSYLILPFVHFILPMVLLRKRKDLSMRTHSFANKIVHSQIYWLVALNICFFLVLAWNLVVVRYDKSKHISYLIPFLTGYLTNAMILLIYFIKTKRWLDEPPTT